MSTPEMFVQSYATKRPLVVRRSPDLHNTLFSSSALYIGAILWAFVLYYADREGKYSEQLVDFVLSRKNGLASH